MTTTTSQTIHYRFCFLAESTGYNNRIYYEKGETFRRAHFPMNTDMFTIDEVRKFHAAGLVSNDITHIGVVQWDFPGSFAIERVTTVTTVTVEDVEEVNEIEP